MLPAAHPQCATLPFHPLTVWDRSTISHMHLAVGDDFAGFRILRILGSGGMGEVYLAQHPRLPRRDALKLLRTDISADAGYRSRFEREADLASTLWHQHIVGLHDRGEVDGQLWIAMDFVDGHNAAELIAQRYPSGMPAELVIKIVSAVGSALDHAHKQGLLHRDVKPANIMVTHPDDDDDRRILLTDFGIARNIDDISGLTTTNMTVGTVAYAAPEQLMGEPLDGRADQYALAATAYHLLTGTPLYPHSNPAVVISHHLNATPPQLANTRPELARYDGALAIALAKDPEDRFTRCTDLAAALADQHGGTNSSTAPTQSAAIASRNPTSGNPNNGPIPHVPQRRKWPIPAAAATVSIIAAAAVLTWQQPWSASQPPADAAPQSAEAAAPPANTGPLTGTYSAAFGPELQLSDRKVLNPANATTTFEIRSACSPTGCVAVARPAAGPTLARQLIFDDLGGQWIAVGTASSTSPAISAGLIAGCEQGLSPETWETLLLQPQPDGTLTGQYEVTNSNNCNSTRTVTMKRTGDVDTTTLDDPTKLPTRIPSPAQGFTGHYRYTYSSALGSRDVDGYVRTDCLRTGDRCMSYFSEPRSSEPFVFADGRWTLHYAGPVNCGSADGPRVQIDRNAELELPEPTSDPIEMIDGQGQEQVASGPCMRPTSNYNLRFTRTGD